MKYLAKKFEHELLTCFAIFARISGVTDASVIIYTVLTYSVSTALFPFTIVYICNNLEQDAKRSNNICLKSDGDA